MPRVRIRVHPYGVDGVPAFGGSFNGVAEPHISPPAPTVRAPVSRGFTVECQTTLKYIDDIEEIIAALGPWSEKGDLARVVWRISQLREASGPAGEVLGTLRIIESGTRALIDTDVGACGGMGALKKSILLNIESLRQMLRDGGKSFS
jgi:hypothetical protein